MSPVSFQKHGLKGINRVLNRLNAELIKIRGKSLQGLILAADIIRRDMDKTPPLIPVDFGNLRSSWFREPSILELAVRCGFTANYAVYVHEMMGANFKRPGAGPKFFQSALRRNKEKILAIIAANARV